VCVCVRERERGVRRNLELKEVACFMENKEACAVGKKNEEWSMKMNRERA